MSTDLTHWHKIGDQPSILVPPIDCCKAAADKALWKLEADLYRQREDAVRDERVRIVTEALAAISAYSDAAQSVLDDPKARLMVDRATEKCAEAIRKVGCICPLIDVTSFGGQRHVMPGYDSRCGMHDAADAPGGPGRGETDEPECEHGSAKPGDVECPTCKAELDTSGETDEQAGGAA